MPMCPGKGYTRCTAYAVQPSSSHRRFSIGIYLVMLAHSSRGAGSTTARRVPYLESWCRRWWGVRMRLSMGGAGCNPRGRYPRACYEHQSLKYRTCNTNDTTSRFKSFSCTIERWTPLSQIDTTHFVTLNTPWAQDS